MKVNWRHLGILLIATQAVGCFGVRYRDSMALPGCGVDCQTAGSASAQHAVEQSHQRVAYDQPMIAPRAKFHPVPTRPAFAPRVEYAPPELIRHQVEVEVPHDSYAAPIPVVEPQMPEMLAPGMPAPEKLPPQTSPPRSLPMPPAPNHAPPMLTAPPKSVTAPAPQPLPSSSVPAKPITAPLPPQINLEQPAHIQPLRGVWRSKESS
ncbi:MAG: hypothetical protein ACIALR_03855 [Blastopirellula sp. JB062]